MCLWSFWIALYVYKNNQFTFRVTYRESSIHTRLMARFRIISRIRFSFNRSRYGIIVFMYSIYSRARFSVVNDPSIRKVHSGGGKFTYINPTIETALFCKPHNYHLASTP